MNQDGGGFPGPSYHASSYYRGDSLFRDKSIRSKLFKSEYQIIEDQMGKSGIFDYEFMNNPFDFNFEKVQEFKIYYPHGNQSRIINSLQKHVKNLVRRKTRKLNFDDDPSVSQIFQMNQNLQGRDSITKLRRNKKENSYKANLRKSPTAYYAAEIPQ